MVAVPKSSLAFVKKQIETFDLGTASDLQPQMYVLRRASASIVQQTLLNLFLSRFPGDVSDKIGHVPLGTAGHRGGEVGGGDVVEAAGVGVERLHVAPGGEPGRTGVGEVPVRGGDGGHVENGASRL